MLDPGCMRPTLLLLPLALLAPLGCSSPSSPSEPSETTKCDPEKPAPAAVPAFEALTTDAAGAFLPIAPDALFERHFGPQGGSHFYVYAGVFSPDTKIWSVSAKLTATDGSTLAAGQRGFTPCEGKWTAPREITVFLEASGAIDGTLHVEATPGSGAPLSYEGPASVTGG